MRLERYFTAGTSFPYDLGHFESPHAAAEILAGAFYADSPAKTHVIEENTLPSWLWRRRGDFSHTSPETSVSQLFDRIAGSAAYLGWKKELWPNEAKAHAFYDDVRYMLVRRLIALEPPFLAVAGIDWAYGARTMAQNFSNLSNRSVSSVENTVIDALLNQPTAAQRKAWNTILQSDGTSSLIRLRFTDTAREWGGIDDEAAAPRLMIDLLKFLRDDGSFDIPGLQHAVRLSTLLLDLHYDQVVRRGDPARVLQIGYANMAPLLIALGLAYDSEGGRSTAAAITAIITAEAIATSAELARAIAPCPAFAGNRATFLRSMRNYRRAAYGEKNDYERISIRPVPLAIGAGADLVFVAAARRCWDEALDLVQQHGLRHLQLTALFATPAFSAFLETSAQGAEPEIHLVRQREIEPEVFQRVIHPAVPLALMRLGCDPADVKAIVDYAAGYGTLRAAPGISHALLRERGFDAAALARVESVLAQAGHIRQAFTPWILGEAFCRDVLKVSSKNLNSLRFDLLRHLGFSEEDIRQANAFCCGHGTVIGAAELPNDGKAIFASDISLEAQIRMAAAAQSFVMGDVHLVLTLPDNTPAAKREDLALEAWRQGVKSVSFFMEGAAKAVATRDAVRPGLRRTLFKRTAPPVPAPLPSHERVSDKMISAREGKPLAKHKAKAGVKDVSMKRGSAGTSVTSSRGEKKV